MKNCLHCGTEFSFDADFCCRGCENAFEVVKSLGLTKFYEHRKTLDAENIEKAQSVALSFDFSNFITEENSCFSLEVFTGGVSCSSCVWLIENALSKQPEITYARLNLTTKKLKFIWSGEKNLGNKFANLIMQMGYTLKPFDTEKLSEEFESEKNQLIKKIVVSGFALVAVMMFADGLWVESRTKMGATNQDMLHWILILIGVPAIIYSGSFFFISALKGLKSGHTNMDVPISSSLIAIVFLSFYQTIKGSEYIYLDSAIMLTFSLLVGRFFDYKVRIMAKSGALEITEMLSGFANVITENGNKIISIKELKQGDKVLVATGEKIPSDAIINKGESEFDTSVITGETTPKTFKIGDNIFAGSINLGQNVEIIITKESKNSEASKILELLENAEKIKHGYSLLAEKATKLYIPIVYTASFFTFLLWYFFYSKGLEVAIINSASVLVITCPCALGLAIPVVNVIAFSKMYKNNLLLKNGETLENISNIDTVIFDKTGTLTEGNFTIKNLSEFSEDELKLAASIATHSKHPIAQAIANAYQKTLYKNIKCQEIKAHGILGVINEQNIMLGKPSWCEEVYNKNTNDNVVCFKTPNFTKFFILEDKIREDAKKVIEKIKHLKITPIILSGDTEVNVKKIAKYLDVEKYQHSLLPEQKYQFISNLKNSGKKVLMVGDGLNDAPAIALADVSIAPSTALGITQNYADLIFKGTKLEPVYSSIIIGRKSVNLIKQNIILSFIYNFIAIPYAAFGFLTPIWAAISMSLSSIFVILNSIRIK
jgi:Cu2+-exporting ATPase